MEQFNNIGKNAELEQENHLYNSTEKNYIIPLISNIKRYKEDGTILPFQIEKIIRQGFVVKISGLYATISLKNMPWKYKEINYWTIVCKQLVGKTFLGKILSVNNKPLSIYVNAAIPQFKKPKYIVNHNYHGIVLEKHDDAIVLELGGHFGWKHGSLSQVLSKEHFASKKEFNASLPGQTIEVTCIGSKEQGEKGQGEGIFINNTIPDNDIANGLLNNWIGKIVPVTVVGTEPITHKYMALNKYDAIMDNVYPEHIIDEYVFTLAKNNLLNTDTIHCEIIQIDREKRCLQVKWIDAKEINKILRRTIPEDTEINIFSLIPTNLLSHDLLLAEDTIRGNPTGSSERFPDSKAFTNAIQEARELLKQKNISCLDNIATWFQDESDWDIFTNKLWYNIRCRILAVVEQIRQEKHNTESTSPPLHASDE